MNETQLASKLTTTGGIKTTTMAFLAAHPLGVAVAGALLIGGGAYYLGKRMANRAADKLEETATPAAAAA
jgi:hypothetical protein